MNISDTARGISDLSRPSPYAGHRAVLATMHGKEAVIAPALLERLGLILGVAPNLDTDVLGTFAGDIPRAGTIREAAFAKARLGMAATGLPIGIASEGSYGPHPQIPFATGGIELMALVDDARGIVISEYLVEDAPVYCHAHAQTIDDIVVFLHRIRFPEHAVIVKAAEPGVKAGPIYKGLRKKADLALSISKCAALSRDGRALVQTDMRAHMNPTRMGSIGRLAAAFAERVASLCPACAMPGYGQVDVEAGLPCEDCGSPSIMVRHRVFGCLTCGHRENRPRLDARLYADPGHCPLCNP